MTLGQLVIGWFYYGIFFMGGSVVVTLLLNRVVKRYFTAPLIINACSVGLLLLMLSLKQLTNEQLWFNLFFHYMPVVFASALCNFILFLLKKGRPLHEYVEIEEDLAYYQQ